MMEAFLDAPAWCIGVMALLLLLLLGACWFARYDGYVAGLNEGDRRSREQQAQDIETGVTIGTQRTLNHLRDTGHSPEFQQRPFPMLRDRL